MSNPTVPSREVVSRLDAIIGAPSEGARTEIVYILAQVARIGQLVGEAFFLRSLYPLDQYDVTIVVPDFTEGGSSVNQECFDIFTRGFNVAYAKDPFLINMGMADLGTVEVKRRRYYLVSPQTLVKTCSHEIYPGARWSYMSLGDEERSLGHDLKKALGVNADAPVATVHVREPGYLPTLTYHSFRDANIECYYPMIAQLLDEGYVVVRFGDQTMRRLTLKHSNLIDAPFCPHYSGFFEPYFLASSELYIGTASGPMSIAHAYNTPMIYANCHVQCGLTPNPHDLFVYKKYFSHRAGRKLSYEEIVLSDLPGLHETHEFTARGLSLVENTPFELVAAMRELRWRLRGEYEINAELEERLRLINRVADRARRDGTLPTRFLDFFNPAHSPSTISHEYVAQNPGFISVL